MQPRFLPCASYRRHFERGRIGRWHHVDATYDNYPSMTGELPRIGRQEMKGSEMGTTRQDLESNFRPLQIYEQVEEKIKEAIRTGRFAAESRLPSERELAAVYGVGRPAVREAIGALQNEGLVVTKRNSGTYVAPAASERLLNGGSDHGAQNAEPDFSPTGT